MPLIRKAVLQEHKKTTRKCYVFVKKKQFVFPMLEYVMPVVIKDIAIRKALDRVLSSYNF